MKCFQVIFSDNACRYIFAENIVKLFEYMRIPYNGILIYDVISIKTIKRPTQEMKTFGTIAY